MNLEGYIKNLDPELQERARACGSVEELLALAKESKVPVPDDVLEAIAGGSGENVNCGNKAECPKCGSHSVDERVIPGECVVYHCRNCGYQW